jgi:hypothetical protein
MKSKKPLWAVIGVLLLLGLGYYFMFARSLTGRALSQEQIENQFPEKIDEDSILPFGYTFGAWPSQFQGEPIVTKLTYQKGPPKKFIEKITQVWRPVEVELQIDGPKTIVAGMDAGGWKACFESALACHSEKKQYVAEIFSDRAEHQADHVELTWFDSLDPTSARGTHLKIETPTYRIDRYTVITESGATQTFSLKTVKGDVGDNARGVFLKILGGLKVKEDLQSSREWIQNKIKSVRLDEVQKIQDPKLRLTRLIQIQNWIYSLLTVDPTHVDPFFHLAGVTHMLAIELMHSKQSYFNSQEAWILSFRPLFETLLAYAKDFPPGNEAMVKNIESLLQDVLYEQNKLTH